MSRTRGLIPFKPGQSGNPKGRPPGSRSVKSILRELCDAPVDVLDDEGKALKVTRLESMLIRLVRKADSKDSGAEYALDRVLDRLEGKAEQVTKNENTNLNVNARSGGRSGRQDRRGARASLRQVSLADQVLTEYRKRFLFYKPHPKQAQFHALGSTCRERLFLAGNRVGKTFGGSSEMAMHLTGHYPAWWEGKRFSEPVDAWAASDTGETTRDILQREYLGNPSKGTLGAIHPSLIIETSARRGVSDAIDTVFVRHRSGGVSQLGFKSYDQGRAKFQGTHKTRRGRSG